MTFIQPPARKEHRRVQHAIQRYPTRGFDILVVSMIHTPLYTVPPYQSDNDFVTGELPPRMEF